MRVNDIWGLAGAIVTVALVTTIVSRPNSAKIISGIGTSFQGSIRAAMGN